MAPRRLLVLETNEVPLRVLRAMAGQGRAPAVARLLERSCVLESEIREPLPREPYPSQTWASHSMGVPYADHDVWWYNDPKPDHFPLYWQAAAREGRSVGLVGTLHSSPVARQCATGDFRFVIPDCFAADSATLPPQYEGLQRFLLAMTRRNSRTASLKLRPSDAAVVRTLPAVGLRPGTLKALGRLTAEIAAGRAPRERLRSAQFLITADLFRHLARRHDPDLAVLFTNHVAAAMHRYWFATFPEDFSASHYTPEWVERHRGEIPWAVACLDGFLSWAVPWCEQTDRTLMLTSSMGQSAAQDIDTAASHEAVIVDAERFLGMLGISGHSVRGAMVPQLSFELPDVRAAAEAERRLLDAPLEFDIREVDRAGTVLTLSYRISHDNGSLRFAGRAVPPAELGIALRRIDDHSSGRHSPRGALIIHNAADTSELPSSPVLDYLEVAPLVLRLLGLAPLSHHRVGARS